MPAGLEVAGGDLLGSGADAFGAPQRTEADGEEGGADRLLESFQVGGIGIAVEEPDDVAALLEEMGEELGAGVIDGAAAGDEQFARGGERGCVQLGRGDVAGEQRTAQAWERIQGRMQVADLGRRAWWVC